MNRIHRRRLVVVSVILLGSASTILLAVLALQSYINHFYLPDAIIGQEAPIDRTIRAGGMVAIGSIDHHEEELRVSFDITDLNGSTFRVEYQGLLPSLFREGQGTIVTGQLGQDGIFRAHEVLAKHDENYVPPELKSLSDNHDS